MKNLILFLIVILLASMCGSGCKSTGVVPKTIGLGGEYRDIEQDIHRNQSDLAVTGERIESESRDIAKGLAALETSIIAASPTGDRDSLLTQVQGLRTVAAYHQAEAEKLNVQLAQERSSSEWLSRKFNEYDQATMAQLSEKDTEITSLKVENKKVTGQRNTMLAIVITAVSVIAIFILIKVLRALKIIPI